MVMLTATRSDRARIAVIDDDVQALRLLEIALTMWGYEPQVTADPVAALPRLVADPPALAIIDIVMPVIDGISLCAELRRHAATVAMPIVLCTALSDGDELERGRHAGADHLVGKPFQLPELEALIGGLIDRRRPRPAPATSR